MRTNAKNEAATLNEPLRGFHQTHLFLFPSFSFLINLNVLLRLLDSPGCISTYYIEAGNCQQRL
jgi:hypothetical protein